MNNILSLDLGTKRIGVARANESAAIPEPLENIIVDGEEFSVIEKLLKKYDANILVVGLPRNSEGIETDESLRVRRVVEKLRKRLSASVDVIFQDESVTSITADSIMGDTSLPYTDKSRDSVAAAVILKRYLTRET